MNNLKITGFFLAFFCLFALNVDAQIQEEIRKDEIQKEQRVKLSPEQRAQKMTDRMTEKLGLDAKQAEQVYALNLESLQKRKEVNAETAKQTRLEQMDKYKSILNEEQYAQLEKSMTKKRREHREKHGQMQRGKDKRTPEQKAQRMTDRMTEMLNLNEKQAAEIQAINLKNAQKRADAKQRMHEKNRAEVMQEYQSVLTPEQYEILEKKQAERKERRGN